MKKQWVAMEVEGQQDGAKTFKSNRVRFLLFTLFLELNQERV